MGLQLAAPSRWCSLQLGQETALRFTLNRGIGRRPLERNRCSVGFEHLFELSLGVNHLTLRW